MSSVIQLRQLDAHIHDLLGGIGDGENDTGLGGRRFQVEENGEMAEEGGGKMASGDLANIGVRAKDIARGVIGSVDLGEIRRVGVSNQLLKGYGGIIWKKRSKNIRTWQTILPTIAAM